LFSLFAREHCRRTIAIRVKYPKDLILFSFLFIVRS